MWRLRCACFICKCEGMTRTCEQPRQDTFKIKLLEIQKSHWWRNRGKRVEASITNLGRSVAVAGNYWADELGDPEWNGALNISTRPRGHLSFFFQKYWRTFPLMPLKYTQMSGGANKGRHSRFVQKIQQVQEQCAHNCLIISETFQAFGEPQALVIWREENAVV